MKLGDSTLPKAPVSGGSQSTASVGPAVAEAAHQAQLKLSQMAIGDTQSPLSRSAGHPDVDVKGGRVFLKSEAGQRRADHRR